MVILNKALFFKLLSASISLLFSYQEADTIRGIIRNHNREFKAGCRYGGTLVIAFVSVLAFDGCANKSVEDERGIAELLPVPPEDVFPTWSPKGDLIAYEHNNSGWGDTDTSGVYLIHCDGTAKFLVAPFGTKPAWHPSGNSLTFAHHGSIWSYDLETRTFMLLVDDSSAGFPAYTPDCSQLSLSLGNTLCIFDIPTSSINVLRDTVNSPILAIFADPNPASGELVFERSDSHSELWIYNSGDKRLRSLIARGHLPRWSPDGQKICYNGENPGTSIYDRTASTSVFVVKLFHPCFSPTGDRIVGTRLVGSLDDPEHARYRIFICDLETKELTQVTR